MFPPPRRTVVSFDSELSSGLSTSIEIIKVIGSGVDSMTHYKVLHICDLGSIMS